MYNRKMKVATQNNILMQLTTSKMGGGGASKNHGPDALLLGGGICLSSMGKISAHAHHGPWDEKKLQRDHWMSQIVQGRRPLLADEDEPRLRPSTNPH